MEVGDGSLGRRRATSESRFAGYVERLSSALGHADRTAPLKAYCTGLMLPGERKSVEPMAARVDPGAGGRGAPVAASLRGQGRVVGRGQCWQRCEPRSCRRSSGRDRSAPGSSTTPAFRRRARTRSGVARQYCGQLGKQDNCQVAVSLSVANDHASLPIAYRLYLPEAWADDPDRRAKAGVPEDVVFRTKPEIALDQIRAALAAGVPTGRGAGRRRLWHRHRLPQRAHRDGPDLRRRHPVLDQLLAAGDRAFAAQAVERAWAAAFAHAAAIPNTSRSRPRQLAQSLPASAWQSVTWREGTNAPLLLALRRRARPPGASRLLALRAAARGMVPDRVATRRERADQILALHLAGKTTLADLVNQRQAALAHRARLPGTQAGNRPRPLRRPRLARLPSPRHALHRRLRIPDLRAESDSPLSDRASRRSSRHLAYPKVIDPAAPPLRPERHVANSIATVRISLAHALADSYTDVHAVDGHL